LAVHRWAVDRLLRQVARRPQTPLPERRLREALLSRSRPGIHCAARVLDDRLLLLVTNEGEARSLTLDYDAAPWLATPATELRLLAYDADGSLLSEERVRSGPSTLTTPVMDRLETRAWELIAARG
jgi:hypothetical protein